MSATTIFAIAWGALILGHWANNKPTINGKQVIEMAFALLVISLLDHGETQPVAKGFAWLFLAAVLLRNDSVLTALAKTTGVGTGATAVVNPDVGATLGTPSTLTVSGEQPQPVRQPVTIRYAR